MGHYDECREENCGVCGQLRGYCEHTSNKQIGGSDFLNVYTDNSKTSDCEKCQKEGVCKWREIFAAYISTISPRIPEEIKPFIAVTVECKHYLQKPKGGIR